MVLIHGKLCNYSGQKTAEGFPIIFHCMPQPIKIMMIHRGYEGIVPYQKVFLVIGSTYYEECINAWVIMIELLLQPGLEINSEKPVVSTTSLTFLGIQINSDSLTLSLSDDKLSDVKGVIADLIHQTRLTKHILLRIKMC